MLRTYHEILSMLQSSAWTTGVSQVNDGSGHRIHIRYNRGGTDREFECVVLVRSSHWYEYRLNVFGVDFIELVVCGRHDGCLPVPVWSVEGEIYNPGRDCATTCRS